MLEQGEAAFQPTCRTFVTTVAVNAAVGTLKAFKIRIFRTSQHRSPEETLNESECT